MNRTASVAQVIRECSLDVEHARRDSYRCRELMDQLMIQVHAGDWESASATAAVIATWTRGISMKLELAQARMRGLRAGQQHPPSEGVPDVQPPEAPSP